MILSYRDLLVWQRSMDLAVECYRRTAAFPASETYGITLQIRKAASSVPLNIAEGRGRRTTKQFLMFIDYAYGSLLELETQTELSRRLHYLDDRSAAEIQNECAEIGRMLNGLRSSLTRRLRPRPGSETGLREQPLNPES